MALPVISRPNSPRSRRHVDRTLLVAWVALACALLPQAAPAQIVISEIMADPAGDWDGDGAVDYRDDEWVEVLNTGSVTVDLAAYWLQDESASEPRLNLSGQLAPGDVAVFYGSDALAWQDASGQGSGALSLNNGGDVVYLLKSPTAGGGDVLTIVDSVAYLDHEAEDDRSCGLSPDQIHWLLFDAYNPYDGDNEPVGTGCAPSPGQPNPCDPLPVQQAPFGGVKALYR